MQTHKHTRTDKHTWQKQRWFFFCGIFFLCVRVTVTNKFFLKVSGKVPLSSPSKRIVQMVGFSPCLSQVWFVKKGQRLPKHGTDSCEGQEAQLIPSPLFFAYLKTQNWRSGALSNVYIKLHARVKSAHSLTVFSPTPPRVLCPPLSVHWASLHSLICSPGCSTVFRLAPCRQSRAEAARICPRTSSSPASGLWMDGTAKEEQRRGRISMLLFFYEDLLCTGSTNICQLAPTVK